MLRRPLLLALALPWLASPPVASEIRFREVSEAWQIDFRHRHGGTGELYMIETMGSGVVLFDYDGDGDLDLLLIDSGPLPLTPEARPRHALLRNDGGVFVDVTAEAGLTHPGYGMGGVAADVDGDGLLDLLVTAYGANVLYRNQGDGTFRADPAFGGEGPSWGASATFLDYDADGWLDLYVTNYVDFTFDNNPVCGRQDLGVRSYCHPDVYDGLPDRLYRNRGDGTFEEVTLAAGLGEADGKGLGVVAADLYGDRRADLYVANDMTPNFFFRNRGDGTFEDLSLVSGAALGDLGQVEAGMGIALGDLDGDGRLDLVVTHLDLQTTAAYRNLGGGLFADSRFPWRLAEPSLHFVGFGAAAADFDNDGWLDLVIANGHILHNAELFGTGTTFRQRNQVFRNLGKGVFQEITDSGLETLVRSSRGLAVGDLTGDGRLDVVISNSDEAAEVWHNVTPDRGNWLQVDLAGAPPNTVGVGATVVLRSGGRDQVAHVVTGSSYLSQNATTLHFGLGEATEARLEVRWPGGARQRLEGAPANRRLRWHGPGQEGHSSAATSDSAGGQGAAEGTTPRRGTAGSSPPPPPSRDR